MLALESNTEGYTYTAIIQQVLTSGNAKNLEYPLEIGFEQHWFAARISPILPTDISQCSVSILIRDITEHKRVEQEHLSYSKQLATVVAVEHALAESLDQASIYATLATAVQKLFPDMATIFISRYDAERKMITAMYGTHDGEPIDVATLPEIPLLPLGEGTQSEVIHTRQPLVITANLNDRIASSTVTYVGTEGGYTESAVYVPMLAQDTVLGVIQMQSYFANRLTEVDAKILALVANTAAVSLQNARLYALAQSEIVERKQTEITLRSSEQHLKAAQHELLELNRTLEERVRQRSAEVQDLYERAPVGYHSLDAYGTVIMVNETELTWLGYTRDEMLGRPITDFMTPTSQATFYTVFPVFRQHGWISDLELEFIRSDGTTLPVLITATAIYDKSGIYVMSRSTLVDMTLRKQAEVTLRRANTELARAARAKDEFLANMSHELRTPLNAILGFSEILLEEIRGSLTAGQRDALHNIESSSHHLLALINDILDLSKVEAGRLDLQLEPVVIADLCQTSLLFIKEMALKKALRLAFSLNDQMAIMEADPKRLKQMLVNLLSNAVKFTPAGGQVRLEVIADAEDIRFAVHDTGIGIESDDLARLFQPFSQLDSSLSRQYEGSGLGLALVRRLAEQHGGSITVESTVNVGSCFTITLPYHRVPEPEEMLSSSVIMSRNEPVYTARISMPELELGLTKTRVLLAEDNENTILTIDEYLQNKGYQVVVARDGYEAIQRAEEVHPDVILMDIQMPELDGLAAIHYLRAKPEWMTTPIIALTALAMPGDRERCLAAGASAYLTKPVCLKGLVTLIERLVHP